MTIDSDFRTLMHVRGCGRPAIYIRERALVIGKLLEHTDVKKLDGTMAEAYANIICGSCGAGLSHSDLMLSYIKKKNTKWGYKMARALGISGMIVALMIGLTWLVISHARF